MSKLTLLEAVRELRMRTSLIKRFRSYSPKNDGTKLLFSHDGTIDESNLVTFNQYLWSEWPSKKIPIYIEDELKYEARDMCGYCGNNMETESAHIDRKWSELAYYCQHPHNLIELCPNCHSRYDARVITNSRIKERKNELIKRLIQEELSELEITTATRDQIESIKVRFSTQIAVWDQISPTIGNILYQTTKDPVFLNIKSPEQLKNALEDSAKRTKTDNPSLTGLAVAYSNQVEKQSTAPVTDYDLLEDEPEEGECALCGGETEVENGFCNNCDEDLIGYTSEELSDMRCPNCGSDDIEIEFEYSCGHCQNILDSDRY